MCIYIYYGRINIYTYIYIDTDSTYVYIYICIYTCICIYFKLIRCLQGAERLSWRWFPAAAGALLCGVRKAAERWVAAWWMQLGWCWRGWNGCKESAIEVQSQLEVDI